MHLRPPPLGAVSDYLQIASVNRLLENGEFQMIRPFSTRYVSVRIRPGKTSLQKAMSIVRDYMRAVHDGLASVFNQAIDRNRTIVSLEAYFHLLKTSWPTYGKL